jgi:argininosuccinate lyase
MKLWGGRFSPRARDRLFEAFSESFSVDQRLILYDLRVNQAYVKALGKAGILRAPEVRRLTHGLTNLRHDVVSHPEEMLAEPSEDVHTWVEQKLEQRVGRVAGKLRTGRSRNDLVATELRLFVKDSVQDVLAALTALLEALLDRARDHLGVVMPGYTHLQPAQPILFSHYLLAYFEMFLRDAGRLEDSGSRADELPLGAGALAGTGFPVDRRRLAAELGFARVARNSLDVTSDRDFVCELLFTCTLIMTHLSRLGEDLIIYSSPAFGYIELADEYSTGSSIMPQKKNPDSLELMRGKAARALGRLTTMLTLLKGLPLAYNRDLQEDKAALFDGVDTARDSLVLAARIVRTFRVDSERMRGATEQGFLTATELADELVRAGIPFAQAHEQVGKLVRYCVAHKKTFRETSAAEARQFIPGWNDELAALAVSPERATERRNVVGGTAPAQVARQVGLARRPVAKLKHKLTRGKQTASRRT